MIPFKSDSDDCSSAPPFNYKEKQFLLFYINRFELFSKLGIISVKWCDKSRRFIPDSKKSYLIIHTFFRILILYQTIFIGSRIAWYLLIFKGTKKIDDFIILATFYMVASGSGMCILILRKNTGATLEAINAFIHNISSLQGHSHFNVKN